MLCCQNAHKVLIFHKVKQIRWDVEKNALLYKERGVSFEDVLLSLERGALLDSLEHPNQEKYPGQKLMVVAIAKYAYLVPCVESADCLFLKTIIPSRKATKKYLAANGDTNEIKQG